MPYFGVKRFVSPLASIPFEIMPNTSTCVPWLPLGHMESFSSTRRSVSLDHRVHHQDRMKTISYIRSHWVEVSRVSGLSSPVKPGPKRLVLEKVFAAEESNI